LTSRSSTGRSRARKASGSQRAGRPSNESTPTVGRAQGRSVLPRSEGRSSKQSGSKKARNNKQRRSRRPAASDSRLRDSVPVLAVGFFAFAVLAGLAVLPARTWLSQRRVTAETEAEVARVEKEREELERQLELLQSDSEIERRAREDFDLVRPGEESYRIPIPSED